MQFGRVPLEQLDKVDWSFPSDHPQTERVLKGEQDLAFRLSLGCTGWSNKAWKGSLYPSDLKDKEMLAYYAQLFDSVELNASHYRIPNPDWVDRWKEEVPKGFKFCPKMHQQVSHRGPLMVKTAMLEQFWTFLEQLGEYAGCTFLQLPERYDPTMAEDLISFVETWPKDFSLSIEFRHPEWFEANSSAEEVWKKMEDCRVSSVITDAAGRRDVLHLRLTNPSVMIRFVGNHPHRSDQLRLQSWIDKLGEWQRMGLKNAWFFLHQHENLGIDESTAWFAAKWNATSSGFQIQEPKPSSGQGQLGLFG
jgi:uncharacterized protein YecE (DUF72 family)